MTRQNKFAGLKEALRERRESPAAPEHEAPPPRAEEREEQGPAARKSKRGRPKGGKRSDPSFQQITLYMPSSLYLGVQKKLKQRRRSDGYEGPRDMSELVSSLVEAWNREV
jgi:hypothetical protein